MLNVGFDTQIYALQKHGGIKNYFSNLIREFQENKSLGVRPILFSLTGRHANKVNSLNFDNSLMAKSVTKLSRYSLLSKSESKLEIVHNTYYLPYLNNFFKEIPHIMTIHDMIPEARSLHHYTLNPHLAKKQYYFTASGIIAVSYTTLNDIGKFYKLSNLKTIKTIHHGIDHTTFYPSAKEKENFFLYVGRRDGYKNGILALEAFAQVPINFRLVLVGGGELSSREKKLLEMKNLSSRIIQINASDFELANLYRAAKGLIITSMYEGFGLPAVEAMASGCPVIASDIQCFREICGDSVIYFNPKDVESLVDKITLLINNDSLSRSISFDGIKTASKYTWAECAKNTADLYFSLT